MCARRWRREEVTGSECDALDGRLRGNSRNQLSEREPQSRRALESPPPPLRALARALLSRPHQLHRPSATHDADSSVVALGLARRAGSGALRGGMRRPGSSSPARVKGGGSARPSCARSRGARASRAEARCGDRRSAKFARTMYVLCFHRSSKLSTRDCP